MLEQFTSIFLFIGGLFFIIGLSNYSELSKPLSKHIDNILSFFITALIFFLAMTVGVILPKLFIGDFEGAYGNLLKGIELILHIINITLALTLGCDLGLKTGSTVGYYIIPKKWRHKVTKLSHTPAIQRLLLLLKDKKKDKKNGS